MLRWLLGPRVDPAVEALADEVAHLRQQLDIERAEKTRLLEEAREERDRQDRLHRRTIDRMMDRQDKMIGDFTAALDARAAAEIQRFRWSEAARTAPTPPHIPPEAEGVGERAMDDLAGLSGMRGGDAEPVWQHSLVAEGHMDVPEDDAEAERAALAREQIRIDQAEKAAAGGGG